jgi:hypothetical protein
MNLCFTRVKLEKDQNHQIEVSQVMNWSTPLRRAHQDTWNRVLVHLNWSLTTKLRLPKDCKWASRAVQSNLGISPLSGLRFQWSRTLWKANEEIYQPTKRVAHLALSWTGCPTCKADRPALGPPVSTLRPTASNRPLWRISTIVSSRFNPRAVVYPTRLYK